MPEIHLWGVNVPDYHPSARARPNCMYIVHCMYSWHQWSQSQLTLWRHHSICCSAEKVRGTNQRKHETKVKFDNIVHLLLHHRPHIFLHQPLPKPLFLVLSQKLVLLHLQGEIFMLFKGHNTDTDMIFVKSFTQAYTPTFRNLPEENA